MRVRCLSLAAAVGDDTAHVAPPISKNFKAFSAGRQHLAAAAISMKTDVEF